VKAPISTMIVRVPEKDRWCGTRGKFMRDDIVDGGRGEDIKYKLDIVSAGKNFTKIRKAIPAGFFFHAN
ncbi:hypothetical protein Tco_0998422, partial [Tanacetum coccineum]